MSLELWLGRHWEYTYNAEFRYARWSELRLTENGHMMVATLLLTNGRVQLFGELTTERLAQFGTIARNIARAR